MALSGPIDHDRGAVRPTAILPGLGGPRGRRRDEPPDRRPAGAPRQRRQPRRARRGHARRRPRRPQRRLRDGVLGHRRGPDRRRPPLPRRPRHGGRDRPRAGRRDRPDLPLRQPRLPRDLRLGPGHLRPAAAQPRRGAEPGRHHPARPRGRRRLPAGDRRRRARARPRGRRNLQRLQPRHGCRGRRPGRGGRRAARSDARGREPVRDCAGRGGRTDRGGRARRASAGARRARPGPPAVRALAARLAPHPLSIQRGGTT